MEGIVLVAYFVNSLLLGMFIAHTEALHRTTFRVIFWSIVLNLANYDIMTRISQLSTTY